MEQIININEYNTIPLNIKEYIANNARDFTYENFTHPKDRYRINQLQDKAIIDLHIRELNELLIDTKIVAGHYTRVENVEEVKSMGLRLLERNEFANRILSIVDKSHCSTAEKDSLINYLYNFENHISGEREGLLFFVYPLTDDLSCKHYSEAIGGEIIEFGKHLYPGIYTYLSNIGIPIKIIAMVPYKNIKKFYKEKLIDNLICVVLHRELDNSKEAIEINAEMGIINPLLVDDIIDIKILNDL